MSRRKRASMREGPLSDLFRSTEQDPAPPPAGPVTEEDSSSSQAAGEEPTSTPPPGETSESPPERLKRVFEEPVAREPMVRDTAAPEAPRYGREEPE